MRTILSSSEMLDQEQEEFTTVSTTVNQQLGQKYPGRPIAIVRSVSSIAQTSSQDINSDANIYYLCSPMAGVESRFLPERPYEFRAIDERSEELASDDIAVHSLSHSISGKSVDFVAPSSNLKHGEFLASKYQSSEAAADIEMEEEPCWRGTFVVQHQPKILFSKEIEIASNKLPTWKPHVVIDTYRLEDDNE